MINSLIETGFRDITLDTMTVISWKINEVLKKISGRKDKKKKTYVEHRRFSQPA
jgi:hypothetical protein